MNTCYTCGHPCAGEFCSIVCEGSKSTRLVPPSRPPAPAPHRPIAVESTRTADETSSPFSDVRCTRCGGPRLKRANGTPGVCSFIPCPAPTFDIDNERNAK